MTEQKPNCYECRFRGTIPGDCHSRCSHPTTRDFRVEGTPHGIKHGWFNWPWNFDPVWLVVCNGFEKASGRSNP